MRHTPDQLRHAANAAIDAAYGDAERGLVMWPRRDPLVVGIIGTRHHTSHVDIFDLLDDMVPPQTTEIVSGGQHGVDSLANRYADVRGLRFRKFDVSEETGTFTERAHARNQKIADASDMLIAFPCEHSKGTWDTIKRYIKRSRKGKYTIHIIDCASR